TEVVPVHRLAYSFGWEGNDQTPPGSSLVEIDLVEESGGTRVKLTHSGLADREICDSHEKGWTHYLGRLAITAAGGDPGPDKM
ncbi:MAG: transcriptional regulator, partial [Mesorhizobium sp.]